MINSSTTNELSAAPTTFLEILRKLSTSISISIAAYLHARAPRIKPQSCGPLLSSRPSPPRPSPRPARASHTSTTSPSPPRQPTPRRPFRSPRFTTTPRRRRPRPSRRTRRPTCRRTRTAYASAPGTPPPAPGGPASRSRARRRSPRVTRRTCCSASTPRARCSGPGHAACASTPAPRGTLGPRLSSRSAGLGRPRWSTSLLCLWMGGRRSLRRRRRCCKSTGG